MSYNGGGGYYGGGGRGGYRGGGGGGGGYRGGGYQGQQQQQQQNRKRGREDDYDQGYSRRRYNDRGDYQQQRGPPRHAPAPRHVPFKTPTEEFQEELWQLGTRQQDSDIQNDILALAESVRRQWARGDTDSVKDTFRTALRDLPHKAPHYAAVVALLALDSPENVIEKKTVLLRETDMPERPNDQPIGLLIAKDLASAIQQYVDERRWRSARLLLFFFAALTDVGSLGQLVSVDSILRVLDAYRKVLEEADLSAARGDEAVRTIVETLIRLRSSSGGDSDRFKDAVGSYLANRKINRDLLDTTSHQAQWQDPVEALISAVTSESSLPSAIPRIVELIDIASFVTIDESTKFTPIDIPSLVIPSELGAASPSTTLVSPPEPSSGLLGNEGVGHEPVHLTLRLFDDDTVPTAYDPLGVTIRSLVADLIAIYEINRKDGASALLGVARWLVPGLFKGKESSASTASDASKDWSLESLIVESILASILAQPVSPLPEAYYYALLGELCRLSPQTVAPPLGKCIRKLYANLGTSNEPVLDANGLRRFAEWFAVHLSNFSFQWSWKEWAGDMQALVDDGRAHPKRIFVEHTIALEVRLSYFDRVRGTIPPELISARVMPDDAPSPVHAYARDDHAHRAAAAQLEKSMRLKSSVSEIEAELAAFEDALVSESTAATSTSSAQAHAVARDMFASTLLLIGSRSFSHFLNILERYLPIVRSMYGTSPDARAALLDLVARFWVQNAQFRSIVVQKLVQYRLVDPLDVVRWLLSSPSSSSTEPTNSEGEAEKQQQQQREWHDPNTFELLRSTLTTTMTRLEGARSRATNLRNAHERARAARGADDDGENVDMQPEERHASEEGGGGGDEEVKAAESLVEDMRDDLAEVACESVRLFGHLLKETKSTGKEEGETDVDWTRWWTEGWFRELCRFLSSSKMDRVLGYTKVKESLADLLQSDDEAVKSILASAHQWLEFASSG